MRGNEKNILVFTSTFPTFLKGDGTPPFVYELSKRLAEKEDLRLVVLTPYRKGAKIFEERDGLKIYRFKYGFTSLCEGAMLPNLRKDKLLFFQVPFLFLFAIINLAKIINKEKIDIIHAHWIVPQGFIAVLYKKIFRKKNLKIICTSHGSDVYGLQSWIMKQIKKWTLNNLDGLTVVSNAIKDEVKKLKAREDLPIEVVSMGVDDKLFGPDKFDPKIKEKYNIKDHFLIFVGRLSGEKGIKYLISAMPEVIQKYPETKLLIVGSGPLENELKNQVKNLNLEKNIIFTGAIPNNELPKYYATADIFIAPSIKEGLPVTYLEAMMSGCIVIGTDLPGNKDIIENGVNGYLVKEKNTYEISEKILELIKNKEKRKQLAKNGYDFVKNNFTWEIIANKYYNLIHEAR